MVSFYDTLKPLRARISRNVCADIGKELFIQKSERAQSLIFSNQGNVGAVVLYDWANWKVGRAFREWLTMTALTIKPSVD